MIFSGYEVSSHRSDYKCSSSFCTGYWLFNHLKPNFLFVSKVCMLSSFKWNVAWFYCLFLNVLTLMHVWLTYSIQVLSGASAHSLYIAIHIKSQIGPPAVDTVLNTRCLEQKWADLVTVSSYLFSHRSTMSACWSCSGLCCSAFFFFSVCSRFKGNAWSDLRIVAARVAKGDWCVYLSSAAQSSRYGRDV